MQGTEEAGGPGGGEVVGRVGLYVGDGHGKGGTDPAVADRAASTPPGGVRYHRPAYVPTGLSARSDARTAVTLW